MHDCAGNKNDTIEIFGRDKGRNSHILIVKAAAKILQLTYRKDTQFGIFFLAGARTSPDNPLGILRDNKIN